MKFKIIRAIDSGTEREEKTAIEKEFKTLKQFIKWVNNQEHGIILNLYKEKEKILIYDYWIE